MISEAAYKLASAQFAKSKVEWALWQTGEGMRTKTIISVDHDEALVMKWALYQYIENARKEIEANG